ncbi:MAG TPA: hypothetical protein VGD66_14710 [Allosphingosinicella sp.]|jgi:hypothetical protein
MDPAVSPSSGTDAQRLLVALERLLGRAMGINMPVYGRFARLPPLPFASLWFAAYAVVAAAIVVASERFGTRSDPRFVSLILWGLGYFTAVLFLARAATLRAMDTVRRDILPYATHSFVAAVAADLEGRAAGLAVRAVPVIAAVLAMIASGIALAWEQPSFGSDHLRPERIFWTALAFYLCFAAARGVLVGRFYEPFARNLGLARERFYVLAAAETPLVRGVASLGQQMVAFWAMIFLAIASIMLLALAPLGTYGFTGRSPLLAFVVPTAGFASLGYGSLIYLRSEAGIRSTLRRFALAQAEGLQRRCNERLDPLAERMPDDAADVERMSGWHDRILAGARYNNRLGTGFSFALPFVMPLLSLAQFVLGGH